MAEIRDPYKISVSKSQEKRPLGKSRGIHDKRIKRVLKK
jgi:hypothetical protein